MTRYQNTSQDVQDYLNRKPFVALTVVLFHIAYFYTLHLQFFLVRLSKRF